MGRAHGVRPLGALDGRHHRIESFCFHHVADNAYLPVDLFHGLLLWGLPVFSEQELLSGRVRDESGAFMEIDPAIENLERILQVHALQARGGNAGLAAYRSRVLALGGGGGEGASETGSAAGLGSRVPRLSITCATAI